MEPTQTKPPLKLRPMINYGDPKEGPPSYCMEPYNMKVDMYDVGDEDVDLQDGVLRKAPMQQGVWMLQPEYGAAIPFIYDLVSGSFWTRSASPIISDAMWNRDVLRKNFEKFALPEKEVRWLHCLRLTNTSTLTRGLMSDFAIVVVDYIVPSVPHYDRRARLEQMEIPILGIRRRPAPFSISLIPEFSETDGADLWAALHLQNQEWEVAFYRGIVSKAAESEYTMQKSEAKKFNLNWHLHRFDNDY